MAAQALVSALMSADAVANCVSMACCWLSTTAWACATLARAAETAALDPDPPPVAGVVLAVPCVPAPDAVPAPGATVETVWMPVDAALLDEAATDAGPSRTAGVTVKAVVAAL